MRPSVLALLLSTPMLPAHAAVQTVPAARIVAAARQALAHLPIRHATQVDAHVVGRPTDAVVQAGSLEIMADAPAGRWPRARVAVPVRLRIGGHTVRTETVWFAIAALRPVATYAEDAALGTPASHVRVSRKTRDVASLHGHPVEPDAVAGQRLRHAVAAGAPLLAEDFEPVPDVDARQQVTVLVRYGAVRLRTRGTALSSGDAGQTVSVLADGAEGPVQAKVTAKGVVQIAR